MSNKQRGDIPVVGDVGPSELVNIGKYVFHGKLTHAKDEWLSVPVDSQGIVMIYFI